MKKQILAYEEEIRKLESERTDGDTDASESEAIELEGKLLKLGTEIKTLKNHKTNSQSEYFSLKNDYEKLKEQKSELWKTISIVQNGPSPIFIQNEINSIEYIYIKKLELKFWM